MKLKCLALSSSERRREWFLAFEGDYLIQTGTGRWDRPEAVPEVTLRRFASEVSKKGHHVAFCL